MAAFGITLIGGPTALLGFVGFRVLTDPTFDPGQYQLAHTTLTKTAPIRSGGMVWPRSRGGTQRVWCCSLPARRKRGPFSLTINANDAIETAHAFPDAVIVPVH